MIRSHTLRNYVVGNWLRLAGLAALSLISAGVALAQPLLLQRLFDQLTSGAIPATVVIALTCLVIVQAAATGIESYFLATTAHGFVYGLRRGLAQRIAHLPLLQLQAKPHGEYLSRLVSDTSAASTILTTGVFKLISAVITFAFAAVIMATIDPLLFLIAASITLVAALLSTVMGRLIRKASRRTQAAIAAFTGGFERILLALPLVRSYGVTGKQLERNDEAADSVRRRSIHVARLGAYIQPVMTIATQALLLLTLAIGGFRVSQGSLSLGELIAFLMYLLMMVAPVSQVGNTFVSIQSGLAAMERIDEVMESDSEGMLPPVPMSRSSRGAVPSSLLTVEAVTFAYPGADSEQRTRIGPLDFQIEAGEHVALVGPSGSGKSTLIALLEQFYPLESGSIWLRGVPQHLHKIDAYREAFAWIPQSSPPIGGSIRENLDIAGVGIPDAQLLNALESVGLSSAQGDELLDRSITEQGANLSGGELQRLGIARALLSQREILLLDEPTSSLDAPSARTLTSLLRETARDKTLIMASHRLADIADFDKIIVLDRGRTVDVGSHSQLIARCALYRTLCAQQDGEPIDAEAYAPMAT